MRFQFAAALAFATLTVANPTWSSLQQWQKSPNGKVSGHHASQRPKVEVKPKTPTIPPPSPPARNRTCYVSSHGNGTDDSPYIMDALQSCNNGGHVVFTEGTEYIIGTALDLTFLNHIDLGKRLNHSL